MEPRKPVAKPTAEHDADAALVRSLLRAQHPDLAERPISTVDEGWDNRVFRLGADLAVRLPRRESAVVLVANEQRWLPDLAARLPVPIPEPVRAGSPGCGFPWPWSVCRWVPGVPLASAAAVPDLDAVGADLGRFLAALHSRAPTDAPANAFRRPADRRVRQGVRRARRRARSENR